MSVHLSFQTHPCDSSKGKASSKYLPHSYPKKACAPDREALGPSNRLPGQLHSSQSGPTVPGLTQGAGRFAATEHCLLKQKTLELEGPKGLVEVHRQKSGIEDQRIPGVMQEE